MTKKQKTKSNIFPIFKNGNMRSTKGYMQKTCFLVVAEQKKEKIKHKNFWLKNQKVVHNNLPR